jgi:hypothetical protein
MLCTTFEFQFALQTISYFSEIQMFRSRCGLSQEKLDQHNWVGSDQRCTAICHDGNACGSYYTQHHSQAGWPSLMQMIDYCVIVFCDIDIK